MARSASSPGARLAARLALFAAIERAYNTFGEDGESPSPASAALLQAAHFALLGALIVADAPAPFAAPDRPRAD